MKFEIDADIPDGFEPTGEYRYPRSGEPFMSPLEVKATTTFNPRGTGRRLILRKKPLAYEDWEQTLNTNTFWVDEFGILHISDQGGYSVAVSRDDIRALAAIIAAAADHVDRVNAQNNNRA